MEPHPVVSREILKQTEFLRRELARETVHLRALKCELQREERRLATFLSRYLEEVGECFTPSAGPASTPHAAFSEDPYAETAMRHVYRRLAKIFHPDYKRAGAANYFHMLREAYDRRDVQRLAELEMLAAEMVLPQPGDAVERLERYERRYQAVLNEKDRLLQKQYRMKNGPEWELMERLGNVTSGANALVLKIKAAIRAELQPA